MRYAFFCSFVQRPKKFVIGKEKASLNSPWFADVSKSKVTIIIIGMLDLIIFIFHFGIFATRNKISTKLKLSGYTFISFSKDSSFFGGLF